MNAKRTQMTKATLLFVGAGLGFLTYPGDAAAQPRGPCPEGPGGHGHHSRQLDTDGDGLVSFEEASVPIMDEQRFSELDANGDGFLDENECPRGPKGHHGPLPDLHAKLREAELNHLVAFVRRLNDAASKGVHTEVSIDEGKQGLLGLYMFLYNLINHLDRKKS